tara:strand:- start:22 stop:696 length:675 start_codon:yes stop_codon:yes gene_type:complete
MKRIIILILVFYSFHAQSGEAFLGKNSQFSFNLTEAAMQKMNLEYSFYFSRSFGVSVSGGLVDDMFLLNKKSVFKLAPQLDLKASSQYIHLDGGEVFIRFIRGNSFENNIIPIGYSVAFGIGITNYDITERYMVYNSITTRNNKRTSLIYDLRIQKTFNIYKSLNFFLGSNLGLINTLIGKDEKETEKVFYALPKRGINSAYSETSNTLERLYFNIHVGLGFML